CLVCFHTCKDPSKLREHMRTHTGERPYECDKCMMSFAKKCVLVRHQQNRKTQYPSRMGYECPVCMKAVYGPNGLNRHMVTHTGDKAFACDQCTMTFSAKQSVRRHVRTVHS
ncbi:unnamed protein product, partial [Sphagnum balticum]